jgi:hypothetical protein
MRKQGSDSLRDGGENRKYKIAIGEDRQVCVVEGFLMRKSKGGCAGMKRTCRVEKGNEVERAKKRGEKGRIVRGTDRN